MSRRRPVARGLVALVLAVGSVAGSWAASPVRAAEDELALVTSSSYRLDPEAGVVRVIVDVTATNNKPNLVRQTSEGTLTTRYFYDLAVIVVHEEATDITATSGSSRLTTRVAPDEGFTVVDVLFRSDLYFGQTTEFTLSYNLTGGAPRSESDIRVGTAFATFYAWAFGDRGDVLITIPDGFEVVTTGSTIAERQVEAGTAFAASGISDVSEWFVVVTADRHDALTQDRVDTEGGEQLVIRAWPEDEEWRTQVGDLLKIGLPVLVEKIGLEWPVEGEIEVAEVHTPLLEGYAGVFYTDRDLIEISEDLDELTIIHEASHAWFNQRLFVGRWINEGFADEYAARVLDEVSVGGLRPDPLTPGSEGAVRLNEWSHPGRIADEETDAREHFGYEASWTVVRELIDDIGEDGMRTVLAAVEAETTAYVGAVEAEVVTYPTDWRRFLDLLEGVGESDRAADLYRRWVIEPEQEAVIAERAAARESYAELVAAGAGWEPGFVVRDPLGRWQFSAANEQIRAAAAVLEVRDQLAAITDGLGVDEPTSLEAAYEGATEELDDVRSLAERQLAAATELSAASAAVGRERDVFTSLGLVGEDPTAAYAAAVAAFESDDMSGTTERATAIAGLMEGADDAGRTRALVGGGAGAGLVALGVAGVTMRRRRAVGDREVVAVAPAGPPVERQPSDRQGLGEAPPALVATAPGEPEPAEPYATLGRQRTDAPDDAPTQVWTPVPPPSAEPDRAGGEDS